jgi:hypothetical protein
MDHDGWVLKDEQTLQEVGCGIFQVDLIDFRK